MKYANLAELVEAAKKGEYTDAVIVDNDCVYAYKWPVNDDENEEKVYGFQEMGPEGALIEALKLLGLKAERA